jgi:nucleotide-binding universal stress UspA family protein
MYKKLLVACDASDGSQIAVVHAAILAKKLGAKLSALWVRGSLPHYPETIDEVAQEEESAREFFAVIKARLDAIAAAQAVAIETEMRAGHPAHQIVAAARERDIDLIVVGSRGHSRLWGELLGHTADRVNENAPCSVLIVRSEQEAARYRRMLVGYDGSAGAITALSHALKLAKQIEAEVRVLWIHETVPAADPAEEAKWARDFFETSLRDRIESAAEEHGLKVEADYCLGNAAQSLVTDAESGGFRLAVMGHRGQSGLWGKLLGGVADRVSHHARCDVLIVREKEAHV